MTKKLLLTLLALMVLATSICHAEENGPGKKLERGVTNIFTGWMEIFITPYEEHKKYGDFVSIIAGIPLGIGKFAVRTIAGGYETVTFPLPLPDDYDPVLTPEFILQAKQARNTGENND